MKSASRSANDFVLDKEYYFLGKGNEHYASLTIHFHFVYLKKIILNYQFLQTGHMYGSSCPLPKSPVPPLTLLSSLKTSSLFGNIILFHINTVLNITLLPSKLIIQQGYNNKQSKLL